MIKARRRAVARKVLPGIAAMTLAVAGCGGSPVNPAGPHTLPDHSGR
jgi:hypothetical protein